MNKVVHILLYKNRPMYVHKYKVAAEKILASNNLSDKENWKLESFQLEPCDCGLGYKHCKGKCVDP